MKRVAEILFITGIALLLANCDKGTDPGDDPVDENLIFSEGFETDFSQWDSYFVKVEEYWPSLSISSEAAHGGSNSAKADPGSALWLSLSDFKDSSMIDDIYVTQVKGKTYGILEFYLMATSPSQADFGVFIGKDAGSSGGIATSVGFGFNESDSIETAYKNGPNAGFFSLYDKTTVGPITPGTWHKCVVKLNFTTKQMEWYLDDALVRGPEPFNEDFSFGVDRLVIICDYDVFVPSEVVKPYYVDDLTFYLE